MRNEAINITRYRIGIINDFNNKFAYINYIEYPNAIVKILDICIITSPHKGFQESKDSIGIFLNLKMVLETKDKKEAIQKIKKLLEKCPVGAKSDFEKFGSSILKAI